ncbi:YkvA family protein [soil metagenome]
MPAVTWELLAAAVSGLLLVWLLLLVVLWRVRPPDEPLREALRLLPDVVRLLTRLARDSSLPRGVRVRLWLLLGYLALPIDLVPDVIPVIGYADDAVLVVWTLRSVLRRAGADALVRHWPGTPDGLEAVRRMVRA